VVFFFDVGDEPGGEFFGPLDFDEITKEGEVPEIAVDAFDFNDLPTKIFHMGNVGFGLTKIGH